VYLKPFEFTKIKAVDIERKSLQYLVCEEDRKLASYCKQEI